MARIELRDALIYIQDGLAGNTTINDTPGMTDTNVDIDTTVLNTTVNNVVPVGARFTVDSTNSTEPNDNIFLVTARLPVAANYDDPTNNITFTPAWGANTPENGDVITFLPQRLTVKIGEGNITYTESKEYDYLLDRGNLDTVREADQQPMDITIDFVYEHVVTGTSETTTVVDALKQQGSSATDSANGANDWVSSSDDLCEPYAVDIIINHITPCGTSQNEETTISDYRYESLEFDLSEATISTSGRCNAIEASIGRSGGEVVQTVISRSVVSSIGVTDEASHVLE